MKRPVIVAIVGESGSGKTALSAYLQRKCNIPYIVSFTTRPMREGERDGVDHYFVKDTAPIPRHPLAYTFYGGHHYWALIEQVHAPVTSYVVDEKGVLELAEHWGDVFDIVAVKVLRPLNPTIDTRKIRDKGRVQLPDDWYDAVIVNTGSEEAYFEKASQIIKQLITTL